MRIIQRPVLREEAGDAVGAVGAVGEVFGFVGGEGAVEEGLFAVAEPLFQDLVAAEGVVPGFHGDVFPAGGGVEVDVEEAFASGAGGGFAVPYKPKSSNVFFFA